MPFVNPLRPDRNLIRASRDAGLDKAYRAPFRALIDIKDDDAGQRMALPVVDQVRSLVRSVF
jgi:hypothetical protein